MKINRFIGSQVFKSINFEQNTYEVQNIRFGADYNVSKKTTIGFIAKNPKDMYF